jgi:hypothetical protein
MLLVASTTAFADETPAPSLASQLLLPHYRWDITGARFEIMRGGALVNDSLTAAGLDALLAQSPAATSLARAGHQRLLLGDTLYYSGLGGVLLGIVGVTAGAAQITDSRAQWGLGTSGAIVTAAGLASAILGAICINDGLAKVLAAVNAYNVELVQRGPPP